VLCCVALYLKIHTCRRRKKRILNLWLIGDVLLLQVCLDLVLLDQLATSGINMSFLFFVALLHIITKSVIMDIIGFWIVS
jgi:hypothetical protein